MNKAIRQASFIAAALAQYTANKSGLDILDDGDLNGFITKMSSAFGKDYQALDATLTALAGLATGANKLPYFTDTDKAAQTDLTQVGRDIIGKNTIADILTYLHLEELPNFAKYGAPMIGELIEWPSDKMPNEIYPDMKMEFIPYIGQSFDPVKYPLLATLHPNLRLPADMRANVARGWDWGRGIDAGRALMSAQDDAMQRITGELTDMCSGDSLQATGALTITAKPAQHWYAAATVSSAYLYYRAIGFDNASVARTANENRMKNVAWNMIVRAK
uniref:phage tail protein n=1 Tax=Citrobacter freundii TaxID=546 RepID=UPI00374FD64D